MNVWVALRRWKHGLRKVSEMKSIFKYPLEPDGINELSLPIGAKMLKVDIQYDIPRLWALVDSDLDVPKEQRLIRIIGTGHMIDDLEVHDLKYIDTFQLMGGRWVFHAFEFIPSDKESETDE